MVVGLRQAGAGRDDNAAMAMHGLVVLNRPCLADALYAKFPLESYKYEYIFFSSLPLSPLIPALRGLSQRKRSEQYFLGVGGFMRLGHTEFVVRAVYTKCR